MRAALFERLHSLGIATTTTDHAPVFAVEESAGLYARIPGAHTKNLFLKDAKDRLWLVIAHHDTAVDLKALPKLIGSARLSFGKADLLQEVLAVTPGSVTAFALMHDTGQRVTAVIDRNLMSSHIINCHPLENTATTSIAREDLLRFIRATGHEPLIETLTTAT
jgi:Ala-tRNA(Pro) deacylase